ncbi:DNA gyrase/topoisomerase IV subunit A [Actinobaculum suis]|uniref:DNA gyrase/topoisomerase IV subunit A n=1 Tax=Actinobaculum suis TaxID=1657 RepID=UPI0008087AEC|nr:DNA topoisomerase IV subunit A [Actinobaculum suis]OCA93971.1 DNA topoisomerase IV [Actinobaculum suis]OCA94537.1 DNA topoisomerase IV [Actinobaculum suis]
MAQKGSASVSEHIVDISVSDEMRTSFLEYSYSVIYARALPDARDGLKPVQRRILYQMGQMGLRPEKGHVKSSRVVGDVMGKLHPHGDTAIYDAMVRLAQPFTMRLPLVDGHGNFGSLDDGPAASRYTEVRLAPAALGMLDSLDEDTVDMVPNYDNTLLQPQVLPAAIPNLLVNGSSGIAVGMATNMPPHNLVEVIAGAKYLLQHPDATVDDLMRFIPGPDLPEGGRIVGLDPIRQAYETGRGTFRMRATAKIEKISARKRGIVFTELPYLVGPEKVIDRIKTQVQAKKLKGISNVQNLTDRHHGTRLVVEVKTGFNPDAVLAQLYQHTPLEDSFGINNVALVDGHPRTLGLKELLQVYIDHRIDVVRRRSKFRLNKARENLHLTEGLLIAVLNIDEVIAVIRSSEDTAAAKARLMAVFDLSEVQAEYILELRLRRLTKYSQLELEGRRDELLATIADLESILGSQARLEETVADEMTEVAREYGTPRRTVLLESETKVADMPLEIADDPTWVMLSGTGLIARTTGADAPDSGRPRSSHDALISIAQATARGRIGVVTTAGRVIAVDVVAIPAVPENAGIAGGSRVRELASLEKEEQALALVELSGPNAEAGVLTLVTAQGRIKRLSDSHPENRDVAEAITLADGDYVADAAISADTDQLVIITSDAQLLRFEASLVRPQRRAGQGIAGIRLNPGARVIALGVAPANDISGTMVVTIAGNSSALPGTTAGSAKVTPLDRFPAKGRGTMGVRAHRFLKGEDVLTIAYVGPEPLRAVASNGKVVELPEIEERRDASGTALTKPVAAIGR